MQTRRHALSAALACVTALFPILAFGQGATVVSEREPIVVYDEKDLNPNPPRYAWEGATLLKDIRVIDGMGNSAKKGQDVLVSGGKIAALGKTGSLDVPSDARVIDGDGLTVLPGIIDAHTHLYGGWRGGNDNGTRPALIKWTLLAFLYNGVTQIFDTGNVATTAADARDLVAAGAWMGPDVKIAGAYFETAPVGGGDESILLPVPDPGFIGGQLDVMKGVFGVEMVKCHTGTNAQILSLLVAEAHERDMRVFCDLWHNNLNPWIARQTKLDGFAHNAFMALPPTESDVEVLAQEGTFVIGNIVIWDAFAGARIEQQGVDYIGSNPLIVDVQPPAWVAAHNGPELQGTLARYNAMADALLRPVRPQEEMRKDSVAVLSLLIDKGVLVGMGTDTPYPTIWTGESMHREMEIWVNEAKISPLRTLQSATYDNARLLKIDDRTGSIQPGLEGDLLVVEGNPAKNISDTRKIKYVFNNGKLVDRESLTRQWRY